MRTSTPQTNKQIGTWKNSMLKVTLDEQKGQNPKQEHKWEGTRKKVPFKNRWVGQKRWGVDSVMQLGGGGGGGTEGEKGGDKGEGLY